jgi:phenylalanyl-tRNA synthetase beta chain
MPTISVNRDRLFERLGRVYTDAEFEDLCFDYGIELDDVVSAIALAVWTLCTAAAAIRLLASVRLYPIFTTVEQCNMLNGDWALTCFPMQTTEKEMLRKETASSGAEAVAAAAGASEEVIYKIDIPANRYDMLCLEGIARALNVFRHGMQPPTFKLADMSSE